jgi:glycosyltransferase involved in cell wall biosynthesis
MDNLPLVSVLTICRNSERTIRRCIESVLLQDYPNLEYVIQDGASTDRTLSIIKEYGNAITLFSEPDNGPNDAHFRGMCKCKGDIVTLCWSDEQLTAGAVSWGVKRLLKLPDVAAIYGDVFATDPEGKILDPAAFGRTPPWNLERFLCWDFFPSYCGSFFRMEALRTAGFFDYKVETDCCMYDYYAKVGLLYPVLYIPGCVGKFALGGYSSTAAGLQQMIPTILSSIDHLLADPRTPEHIRSLRQRAYAGIHLSMLNSLITNAKAYGIAQQVLRAALNYEPDLGRLDEVLLDIIGVCVHEGHYADGLAFLEIVRERGLAPAHYHLCRARICWALDRREDCLEAARAQLVITPDDPETRALEWQVQQQGIADAAAHRLYQQVTSAATAEKAIQGLQEALQRTPRLDWLDEALGKITTTWLEQERAPDLWALLRVVEEYGVTTKHLQLWKTKALFRLKRFQEGLETLRRQAEVDPLSPALLNFLWQMRRDYGTVFEPI